MKTRINKITFHFPSANIFVFASKKIQLFKEKTNKYDSQATIQNDLHWKGRMESIKRLR